MTDTNWSASETEVLARLSDLLANDRRGVLATILDVEGSAYRRPGAKMVVSDDGEGIGHVTAGCLESEVQDLARDVLEAGEPRVETYDLRPESGDDVWGLGVGCNGVIDVLLEPIDRSYRPVIEAVEDGDDVGVATIVGGDDDAVGARAYYDPDEDAFSTGDRFPDGVTDRLRGVTGELAATGTADSVEVGDLTVFVDGVAAPNDLVVVGTGHDVGPIVELGAKTDFRVTVVGYRGANARAERFPAAHDVRSTSPARIRDAFDFDRDTYVVIATHNFVDDRITVDELLGHTDVPYVGLMGPHERFEEMLEDFEAEGRDVSDAELSRLYTPVGLDLGGGSPYQIALSVVGEVLAVCNDRDPGHLRDREGHIHDRIEVAADRI